jgi:hypothetical protein
VTEASKVKEMRNLLAALGVFVALCTSISAASKSGAQALLNRQVLASTTSASSEPASNGSRITHEIVFGYDVAGLAGMTDGARGNNTTATSRAWIQQWYNYAEGGANPAKNSQDCPLSTAAPYLRLSSCVPIAYFDPNKHYVGHHAESVRFYRDNDSEETAYYHSGAPTSPATRLMSTSGACGRAGPGINPPMCLAPNVGDKSTQSWYAVKFFQQNFPPGFYGEMDDTHESCSGLTYRFQSRVVLELGGSGSICDANDQQNITAFQNALHWQDGTPIKLIVNGVLESTCGNNGRCQPMPSWIDAGLRAQNVVGAFCEGCLNSYVDTNINVRGVPQTLNTASVVIAANRKLLIMLNETGSHPGTEAPCASDGTSCGNISVRQFDLAFRGLAYDVKLYGEFDGMPNGEPGGQQTGLEVFPEQQIVFTDPITTMSAYSAAAPGFNGSGCTASGQVDASQAGGAVELVRGCGTLVDGTVMGYYAREFRSCYNYGVASGPCAVLLNPTSTPVSVDSFHLTRHYAHMLTIGTQVPADVHAVCELGKPCPPSAVNPTGAAVPTVVGPASGVTLFL